MQHLQPLINERLSRAIWKERWSELHVSWQILAAFYGFWGAFLQRYYMQFYEFLPHKWTGILIERNACCLL